MSATTDKLSELDFRVITSSEFEPVDNTDVPDPNDTDFGDYPFMWPALGLYTNVHCHAKIKPSRYPPDQGRGFHYSESELGGAPHELLRHQIGRDQRWDLSTLFMVVRPGTTIPNGDGEIPIATLDNHVQLAVEVVGDGTYNYILRHLTYSATNTPIRIPVTDPFSWCAVSIGVPSRGVDETMTLSRNGVVAAKAWRVNRIEHTFARKRLHIGLARDSSGVAYPVPVDLAFFAAAERYLAPEDVLPAMAIALQGNTPSAAGVAGSCSVASVEYNGLPDGYGLTEEGFRPLTFDILYRRIIARLKAKFPDMDARIETPEGQLAGIFAFELDLAWSQLANVYHSYDPDIATGEALDNLGRLTGVSRMVASHSRAYIKLVGTSGTPVPAGSTFTDGDGNIFYSVLPARVGGVVGVVAREAGPIPVPAGAITGVGTSIAGLTGVVQEEPGTRGQDAMSEVLYRNLRNQTTQRNLLGSADGIYSAVVETGATGVNLVSNDSYSETLPDGTPPGSIHVTVTGVGPGGRGELARAIYQAKGVQVATYGSLSEFVQDPFGGMHTINFSIADGVPLEVYVKVKFGDLTVVDATDLVKEAISAYVSGLSTGASVVWSKLIGVVSDVAEADVLELKLGKLGDELMPETLRLHANEIPRINKVHINVEVV